MHMRCTSSGANEPGKEGLQLRSAGPISRAHFPPPDCAVVPTHRWSPFSISGVSDLFPCCNTGNRNYVLLKIRPNTQVRPGVSSANGPAIANPVMEGVACPGATALFDPKHPCPGADVCRVEDHAKQLNDQCNASATLTPTRSGKRGSGGQSTGTSRRMRRRRASTPARSPKEVSSVCQ
jgi:hypothetical protein